MGRRRIVLRGRDPLRGGRHMRHPQEVLGRARLIAGSALGLALLVDRRGQSFGDIGALWIVGGRDRERVRERVLGLGKIALVETYLTDDGPGDALLGRIDTWGSRQQRAGALCRLGLIAAG